MPVFLLAGVFVCQSFIGILPARAGLADHVVINELAIDSLAGTGGSEDDWVELYNPTDQSVSLEGWTLQKFASGGTSGYKQVLAGTIPARSYFLVVRDGATTAQALKDKADLVANDSFGLAAGNIVYLTNNGTTVVPGGTNANIVDLVGFGTASFYEGAAAAPAVPEAKSIARVPDGEDTDANSVDFTVRDTPTPQNSEDGTVPGTTVGGTVVLTIVPSVPAVRNIAANSADIAFTVNGNATAQVEYGLSAAYGSATVAEAVLANVEKTVPLSNLACGTTYHYRIKAENANENDLTLDATFDTMPCGIRLDSLVMTKEAAKASNQYANGWEWQFDITVWDLTETTLKLKFSQWTGPMVLATANNIQFSANGTDWFDITADGAYPSVGAAIGAIDRDTAMSGRQVRVIARMKVPVGTLVGHYDASYGILTE